MLTTTDLTSGERLRIKRRRENLTQADLAQQIGVPLGTYKRMEADDAPDCWEVPSVALGRLQPHEACLVMRKREGLTLDALSDKVGLSKWWLCLIEQGKAPADSLVAYWTRTP